MKSKILLVLEFFCFVTAIFFIYAMFANINDYKLVDYKMKDVLRLNAIICAITSVFFFLLGGTLISISYDVNYNAGCIDMHRKEIRELKDEVQKLKNEIEEIKKN